MEKNIKNNLSARHKTLASPPIILAEHNLSVRTYPALIFAIVLVGVDGVINHFKFYSSVCLKISAGLNSHEQSSYSTENDLRRF